MTSMVQISSSKWPLIYCLILIPLLLDIAAVPGDGSSSSSSSSNSANVYNIIHTTNTTDPQSLVTQTQPTAKPAPKLANIDSDRPEPVLSQQHNVINQQQQQQSQNGSTSLPKPGQQQQQQQQQHKPNQGQDKSPPRRQQPANDEYMVGVGIADITGPAADINLVSLMRLLAASSGVPQFLSSAPSSSSSSSSSAATGAEAGAGASSSGSASSAIEDLIQISYPSMGYAKPNQDAGGIHLRQFSRSIIVEDTEGRRVLYTSIDNGMISQLLRTRVLRRLQESYGPMMFNESNVMMTATHSHSCPGGFFQYMLYNIPSSGFISQTLEALVDGMLRSIDRAAENMKPARIYYNEGELLDASINRSPTSYENNPIEERQNYQHNTDKTMRLLKIVDRSGEPMAMINWFAVHGTSMNNTNRLISSDNKGYASILFEQEFNGPETLPGKGKFVAIFAQANEGDVSPNTMGPRCIDSGLPCDLATSTCNSSNEKCIASGPGKDMFESTKIIAYKQYNKARQLFLDQNNSLEPIRGPIRFVHEHIDMTQQQVPLYKSVIDLATKQEPPQIPVNSTYQTCQASLGYSFAAGTTDGPGAFDFQQGDMISSRYWNMVRDFLRRPTQSQIKCHHPKPILLSTGEMDFPYMWHPKIVPTQILMIGQLAIVGLPGEFTTMAGRRVRNIVQATLINGASRPQDPFSSLEPDEDAELPDDGDDEPPATTMNNNRQLLATRDGGVRKPESLVSWIGKQMGRNRRSQFSAPNIKVALSGLSNIYTSYVTTLEEYEMQRYEGASTLYGPHTLQAYMNQFRRLAAHLVSGEPVAQDGQPKPPDLSKSLFNLKPGVLYDSSQHGHSFGDVLQDVNKTRPYRCQEVVSVSFVAGNPRNDLRQEDSFLYVDKYMGDGNNWSTIATDASWDTKFIWKRTNTMWGESRAIVQWDIPHNCQSGYYRIRHQGAHKNLLRNAVSQYSGQSSTFMVLANDETIESLIGRYHGIATTRRLYMSRS